MKQPGYNMKGRRPGGWRRARPLLRDPALEERPNAWARFLDELGLSEAGALDAARLKLDGWGLIRAWVRGHRRRRFVPEDMLDALEMTVRDDEFFATEVGRRYVRDKWLDERRVSAGNRE